MSEQHSEKPCLVQTGRGFSVLYRNRFLYSKYDPSKSVLSAVRSLQILPGTLILACSPCLGTGLGELAGRLPDKCMILGCEPDPELYEFARAQIDVHTAAFALLHPSELPSFPVLLNTRMARTKNGTLLPPPGTFRRVLRLDFSAGTQFQPQFFSELTRAAEEAVGRFWKNRITLVKLGRRYSRNLFRNLPRLCCSAPLDSCVHTVTTPIVVFGAGESMEESAALLKTFRERTYVVAVDAAFPALCRLGVIPDAVICEEAQSAIAPAFFGVQRQPRISFFSGITSWPALFELCPDKTRVHYFAPRYDDTIFFRRLCEQSVLPPVIPPLGSVGLTAVYLALNLRSDGTVPVYVTGLDFSYSAGKTHARGTPAHTARLFLQSRTAPAAQYDAAVGYGAVAAAGKNGASVRTTPALLSYAQTFTGLFSGEKNLFDAGKTGLPLGLPYRSLSFCADAAQGMSVTGTASAPYSAVKQRIMEFYETEDNALCELTGILSNGLIADDAERDARLRELLAPREYLYLHFPDGWELSLSPSFLKRVRAEIDFFRKDIRTGKRLLDRSTPRTDSMQPLLPGD